jgi:hypothetical protein
MSSKGGPIAKLLDVQKARNIRRNGNTFKPLLNRNASTFAEKNEALRAYQLRLSHEDERGNPKTIAPFGAVLKGTGVPDEGYKFDVATGKFVMVLPAKVTKSAGKKAKVVAAPVVPTVAKWSRRGGFAGR